MKRIGDLHWKPVYKSEIVQASGPLLKWNSLTMLTTDFVIFNSAGTTLYSSVYDNDQFVDSSSGLMNEFIVANGLWIQPNTRYYVMFRSTTASANKNIFRLIIPSATMLADFTGGIQWGVSRYASGTFIDDATAIPSAALEICGIRYFQTPGGTTTYSLPAGFNQLSF